MVIQAPNIAIRQDSPPNPPAGDVATSRRAKYTASMLSNKDSLVEQLQKDILDSSVPLADILRKAKVLASLLKSEDLMLWVDAELKGYADAGDIPTYRKFHPLSYGTLTGINAVVRNVLIPVSVLPDNMREYAENLEIRDGVGEIEAAATRSEKENCRFPWPAEMVILAREYIQVTGGGTLTDAWRPFSQSDFVDILDQIRTRLLDFLLELQQINPDVLESEEALRSVPAEKTSMVVYNNIYGNENVVATGRSFTQTVTQEVVSGDKQSLIEHLRSIGLQDRDALGDLESAIEQDGDRQQKSFGKNVKAWMAKMIVKAMDGAWEVAEDTAPALLKAALSKFYGWD